jgi:hypothetical protein
MIIDEDDHQEMLKSASEYVAALERKAKAAIVRARVLVAMVDEESHRVIEQRLYRIAGHYPSVKKPIECVLNFSDGSDTVRIEYVGLERGYQYGNTPRFGRSIVDYRVRLKNGRWSKSRRRVDAIWAIEQLEGRAG